MESSSSACWISSYSSSSTSSAQLMHSSLSVSSVMGSSSAPHRRRGAVRCRLIQDMVVWGFVRVFRSGKDERYPPLDRPTSALVVLASCEHDTLVLTVVSWLVTTFQEKLNIMLKEDRLIQEVVRSVRGPGKRVIWIFSRGG